MAIVLQARDLALLKGEAAITILFELVPNVNQNVHTINAKGRDILRPTYLQKLQTIICFWLIEFHHSLFSQISQNSLTVMHFQP